MFTTQSDYDKPSGNPSFGFGDTNYQNTYVSNIGKHYSDRQLYGSMRIDDDENLLDYG